MAKSCLNTAFIGVSTLSAIVALGLVGCGVWYSLTLQEITSLRTLESTLVKIDWTQVIPYVFVAVGVFGFLIAFCGFFGICGSKPCFVTYNVCAVIVIIAMIGAAFAAIVVATQNNEEFIKVTFGNVIRMTERKQEIRKRFSEIESRYHCCGADGDVNYRIDEIPPSCCDKGTDCNLSANPRPGCIKVFTVYSEFAFYAGTAGCALVAILAIASICLSTVLIRRGKGGKTGGDI
ncbi:hypothetical protein O0L34_g10249 [Tuta absoluta]|nr:hypothetical protein O0L34_g10249 [Tuta absoluta]